MTTRVLPELNPVDVFTATPECMAQAISIPWFKPLWPSQRDLLSLLRSSDRVLFLKARQLRFTWTLALWALHRLIDKPGISGAYVSLGEAASKDVARRVLRLYAALPDEVRAAYPMTSVSLERIAIGHADEESELLAFPSSTTAGRGRTLDFLIGDERPQWPHPEEQEASLMPAAAQGKIIMGGTANGFDTFRDRWLNAEAEGWDTIFAGALADPSRSMEWVRAERARYGALGPQEYPLSPGEAFVASGRCVFDVHALQGLLDGFTTRPIGRFDLRRDAGLVVADAHANGRWMVWDWPRKGRSYVIAADVCGGGGGDDYAYATVHDAESWDQVAALHGRPDPGVLAGELATAGWLWSSGEPIAGGWEALNGFTGRIERRTPSYPRTPALLIPEANNHGQAVVALLREWGYPRIYTRETFDRRGSAPVPSANLGWLTTGKSRDLAISALQDAIRDGEAGIRDQAAVGECLSFIDNDGRYEAAQGAHDDRVMALAIAYAVLGRSRSSRRVVQEPQAPYRPSVSELTAY